MTQVPSEHESDNEFLMRVRRDVLDGGVVLHVTGEVDLGTAPDLDAELTKAEEQLGTPGTLVVDLTAVSFLASAGLGALVAHDQRCRDADIDLRIVTGNRAVARTMMMTGLTEALAVFATLAEATSTDL